MQDCTFEQSALEQSVKPCKWIRGKYLEWDLSNWHSSNWKTIIGWIGFSKDKYFLGENRHWWLLLEVDQQIGSTTLLEVAQPVVSPSAYLSHVLYTSVSQACWVILRWTYWLSIVSFLPWYLPDMSNAKWMLSVKLLYINIILYVKMMRNFNNSTQLDFA